MSVQFSNAQIKISTEQKSADATPCVSASSSEQSPKSACTTAQVLGEANSEQSESINALLQRYRINLCRVSADKAIPGSYWGDREAGLIGANLYARADTPVHSILHEACHYICMHPRRRADLHTDAGGSVLEECAVCYLSILLAEQLFSDSQTKMFHAMDEWGYSFRLGSAAAWFHEDAEDAAQWLLAHGLIDTDQRPLWLLRTAQ